MEEDEPDYNTPIGKVIKHINTLSKKPQIDEQLSEALELFSKKLEEQEKYLVNGIFKINFSEAALFMQSSAELYGKKIDLLWDQLLEYHTRLITYDCENQKEKGVSIDKSVIEKLEERRNRYKRRKKFKLHITSSESQILKELLFDKEKEAQANLYDEDAECESRFAWKEMEGKAATMREIPKIVYKQMSQLYRLKNYHILKCMDFDIYDIDDGEFNTKYSRIPGWHHILHLFEYNKKGLLPDQHNTIAKLRLSAYGRIRFLNSRKIHLHTPFEEYKEEYMAFRKKYFEEEAKKWQNMPLDTLEDLRKQLAYLVQKEREENGEPTNDENAKLGRYGVKEIVYQDADKIISLDTSDEDSLFELALPCDKDFMKSDLFVSTKLRQDSGFYELDSDDDGNVDNSNEVTNAEGESTSADINGKSSEQNESGVEGNSVAQSDANLTIDANIGTNGDGPQTDTSGDLNKGSTEETSVEVNSSTIATDEDVVNNGECPQNKNSGANLNLPDNATGNLEDCSPESGKKMDDSAVNGELIDENTNDSFETRSYISDHDYCQTIPPLLESTSKPDASVSVSAKDSTKQDAGVSKSTNKTPADGFNFPVPRIMPRIIKIIRKNEKQKIHKKDDDHESPPKRRKLSAKQVAKLLKSRIKPVKEKKFEKFFSLNYEPQLGEGEILHLEYESEYEYDSDDEHDDEPDAGLCDQARQDETQSIMSDHDYCQRTEEESHNDSGFVDTSGIFPLNESEPVQENSSKDNSGGTQPAAVAAIDDRSRAEEEKYEKLLAALRESQNDPEQAAINLSESITKEAREKELKAVQTRVEEWRGYINPILRNLKENDFDIHEYGSKIMDNLEVTESRSFGDIVQGKCSAEVVRYFISSLQLANTGNIEICGAQKGRMSNDTFKVKLLTKDRYHEHLSEYLAPSEETYKEKLKKVKAISSQNRQESVEPTEAKTVYYK
ncbi:hypothetical protein NQ317_008520, partial [Molorchus minor]